MATLITDIKYAFRMLRKKPGFTAIALITLAIGIAANTMMYSLADLLLFLKPREVKQPEDLVLCSLRGTKMAKFHTYSGYQAIGDSGLVFEEVAAQSHWLDGAGVTFTHRNVSHEYRSIHVSWQSHWVSVCLLRFCSACVLLSISQKVTL